MGPRFYWVVSRTVVDCRGVCNEEGNRINWLQVSEGQTEHI